jgi:alpha-mannosidase
VGGDSYGIALLNDSKYGYDALGGRLRLTLLRSAYEPDAISDAGQHSIRYSLLPHPGSWREAQVVHHAMGFNQPLLARQIPNDRPSVQPASEMWRPRLSRDTSVQIATLKPAREGSGRVVRLYESAGHTVEVELYGIPGGARAWETNLVEERISAPAIHNGSILLVFRPWQVRTLLVETSEEG